jgi:predicted methyltransferase
MQKIQPHARQFYRHILNALLLMLMASNTWAQETNVNPSINRHYEDADYARWFSTFERPGRDIFDQRYQVMDALAIKPGMDIADIGAGTGLYTRLFAPAVGHTGKVYAVDPAENFIEEIVRQSRRAGFNNVVGIVNSQDSTGLDEASIDMAFVCATYHHFEYPKTMLQSMHRALRPGGELVIIDFRKIAGRSSQWVMGHTRAGKAEVIHEIESEGFELTGEYDFLRDNYFLRFKRL